MSDEWWVMEIEWWKLSDHFLLAKQALNVDRGWHHLDWGHLSKRNKVKIERKKKS